MNVYLWDDIQNLINDLRASQLNRKQAFGNLYVSKNQRTIQSYCAMGALGCATKLVGYDKNQGIIVEPNYAKILHIYGIHHTLKHPVPIAYYRYGVKKNGIVVEHHRDLASLIVELNDNGYWNFEQIAQFISILRDMDVIKPCTKTQRKQAEKARILGGEIQ